MGFLRARALTVSLFLALLAASSGGGAQQARKTPPQPRSAGEPARIVQTPNRKLLAARRRVLDARPLTMYYYSDNGPGLASLRAHASKMTILAPQCFHLTADGIVLGRFNGQAAEIARQANLPVMPLVINPDFDRSLASAILRDPQKRNRVAAYLSFLANKNDFVGIQIDMENIDPADKFLFTRFVAEAAARLHRDGRLISIAVIPRFSDRFPDNRNAEFRTGQWGAGFDFRALGRLVDFMTLMTYDQSGANSPPGPVAGYAWMEKALDYAVSRVPRWEILLGIPFYGREWTETNAGLVSRDVSYPEISTILARPGATLEWNARWRTPWVRYQKGSEFHMLWFDNNQSLGEKLRLVRQYGLRGFAAWRLGGEDPIFWTLADLMNAKLAQTPSRKRTPSRLAARKSSGRKKRAITKPRHMSPSP